MYICMCTPTTDKEIKIACRSVKSEEELKNKLNICKNCKSCEKEINILYNNSLICKSS